MRVLTTMMSALTRHEARSLAVAALLAALLGFGVATALSDGPANGRHGTVLASDGTAMGVGRN